MNRIEQAAYFGHMMGKVAATPPSAASPAPQATPKPSFAQQTEQVGLSPWQRQKMLADPSQKSWNSIANPANDGGLFTAKHNSPTAHPGPPRPQAAQPVSKAPAKGDMFDNIMGTYDPDDTGAQAFLDNYNKRNPAGSNNPAPAKPSMSTQQVNGIMSDLKSFYQK